MRCFARFGTICTISKTWRTLHERVLLLVKLQSFACNFTKSFTPPWVFFTFFKLYKWYQIQLWINFYQIFFSTTWDIVPSEISSKEQDWTPVKYLNVLNNNKTQKQLRHWTKIFYYTGKILFIIFSSKSFMANFFFEILYKPISNDSIIL